MFVFLYVYPMWEVVCMCVSWYGRLEMEESDTKEKGTAEKETKHCWLSDCVSDLRPSPPPSPPPPTLQPSIITQSAHHSPLLRAVTAFLLDAAFYWNMHSFDAAVRYKGSNTALIRKLMTIRWAVWCWEKRTMKKLISIWQKKRHRFRNLIEMCVLFVAWCLFVLFTVYEADTIQPLYVSRLTDYHL